MSTRYGPALDAIDTALSAIAPGRVVTRHWTDFANRPDADLVRGVLIVRPRGLASYPYEISDNGGATDSLRATEHGQFRLNIICQARAVSVDASGEEIDAIELAIIHELEQLADAAMDIEGLETLRLLSADMSQQVETPYAWVYSTWELSPL